MGPQQAVDSRPVVYGLYRKCNQEPFFFLFFRGTERKSFVCVLLAYRLRTICVLFAYHLRTVCVLLAYRMRTACVLYAYHLRTVCVLFAYCLRTVCVPFAYCLRTVCVPFAYCLRTICVPIPLPVRKPPISVYQIFWQQTGTYCCCMVYGVTIMTVYVR